MSVKWWTLAAVGAIVACSQSTTAPSVSAEGFWTGTVPQGSLEMRIFDVNSDLDGFGIIQSTAGPIDIQMVGSRSGASVNFAVTQGTAHTSYATFAGEVSADSLVGTWTTIQGGGAATVRLSR
jgi:hypothetical protein